MTVVSLSSGLYCQEEAVVAALAKATGRPIVTDSALIQAAADLSGLEPDRISQVFAARTPFLARCSHAKEQGLAWLRLALATRLVEDENLLLTGWCAVLVPRRITHVLAVCLIADAASRLHVATQAGLPAAEARPALERNDTDHVAWTRLVTGQADPWDPALYDLLVPMDKTAPEAAAALILGHQNDPAVRPTEASRAAARDFLLGARVETVLAGHGHGVAVAARNGRVTLTINRRVLFLERLEKQLRAVAMRIEGVQDVMTKVGRGFYQSDIYRQADFERTAHCLPTIETREFIQAQSERLERREDSRQPA
ncbi:cytidylate kinase family protein [Desulfovibrio sp. TomC]|uniref:cytidylate kinase family protein n=1 Tax=Desulfovibrio sp. TomC TaxID=1562888 RepID=UPI0005731820|nr:cytidylate kinase family protein [Desulfovibrio sp. TomC]KHK02476.1 hypothetical protein NY78_2234 [Desulfovibrio sp. TomC]